ncbi:MAG TPA: IclR family transcriptional regulator [Candidatus Aphodoplasma excrementigallinarum]|uniref:IclR family transcriptional regulator n=1 Tax=Candidatus Aphodoplasma excrementigallinarum TaxID=2840673 RepID=A0A9D1NHD1_9FIRM|nr:IclR family transcriptional regulator [Candidatus Aphodoplasma excrementigallinarum]
MEESKHRAPAAAAAIKIVESIAQAGEPVGLSDISGDTGINKNMISRILPALTDAGWVVFHQDTGKYSLSLQLFRLGSTALQKKTLMRCATPYLKRLNDLTGECIQMAVLYENQAVYIAQMDSKKVAGIRGQIGASYSLDTTAPGKVLKAFVRKDGDKAMTKVRKKGYAIDNEEYGRGVICIAAPVYDYSGEAVAAIGIASLTVNHSLCELVDSYVDILLEQVNGLSRELGYGRED